MYLSKRSLWALKAILYIAGTGDTGLALAGTVAEQIGAPPHMLRKVLQRLALAGLLISQRGVGGGFFLVKTPEEITLLDIVLAVDGEDMDAANSVPFTATPAERNLESVLVLVRDCCHSRLSQVTVKDLLSEASSSNRSEKL